MVGKLLLVTTSAMTLLSPIAEAQHSAAQFQMDKEVLLTGKLLRYDYRNLHIYLTLEMAGADGNSVTQEIEVAPVSVMQPLGLMRDSLQIGDRLTVRANPYPSNGNRAAFGRDVTRADGKDEVIPDIDWIDTRRVIDLRAATHQGIEPASQGHSIHRWEGDTLIVGTAVYAPHPRGTEFGELKHVIERFSLADDKRHLMYDATVEDPVFLTEPLHYSAQWEYSPDLTPSGLACDPKLAKCYLQDVEQP